MKLKLLIIGLALSLSALPSFAGGIVMMGGGVAATAPSYTTVFSSYWDGSDAIDTGGTGTGVPWTSSSGTDGSLSDGKYSVTISASSTGSYLIKSSLTAHGDVQLQEDVAITSVTSVGANTGVMEARNGTNPLMTVTLHQTSGNYDYWRITYRNGSNTAIYLNGSAYSFTAGHTYSIRLVAKCSTSTSSADGTIDLYVSDNGAAETHEITATGLNTYYATATAVRSGAVPEGTVTNTWSFDNFTYGYK